MAIAAAMRGMEVQRTDIDSSINNNEEELVVIGRKVVEEDGHENDVVMPGFRFHPTEEELIDFYLRRKVEGKRFNVDLITFLDLYRYDPWELPALATIGEKEWFFYVPRDRKYRNGDRPNRVTTSGYWKATGADRTIRSDQSSRSIGLKKTLVFYSGKAPKGIRTAWIMNEYRLPHSNTDQYNKGEISLCRVYKRASDPSHLLPATLPSKPSSSSNTSDPTTSHKHHKSPPPPPPPPIFTSPNTDKIPKTTQDMPSIVYNATTTNPIPNTISATSIMEEEQVCSINLHHPKSPNDMVSPTIDELNRIVGYNQSYLISNNNQQIHILPSLPSQPQLAPLTVLQPNSLPNIPDKLWEWSSLPETGGWKRI